MSMLYIRKQTQQYAMGREGGREEKEDREGEGGREGRKIGRFNGTQTPNQLSKRIISVQYSHIRAHGKNNETKMCGA